MKRRLWMAAVLAAVCLRPAAAAAPRPNIILILTDDQRWDMLDGTHAPAGMQGMPLTRNLLAGSGVTFSRAYAATPICAPGRSSILTGKYAHNHLVKTNSAPHGGATVFQDSATIATALQAAGYRTGLYGKYINEYNFLWPQGQPPYVPPGWTEWHAFKVDKYYQYILVENGIEVIYGTTPADYSTDLLKGKAVTFLQDSVALGQPFFLYFSPFAAHDPAIPAPRHTGMFAGLSNFRPPNFNEADVSDKPAWLQATPLLSTTKINSLDSFRISQMESLQAVDEAVSSIVSTLQTLGVLQNTLIVFTSDNGHYYGEHRLDFKDDPYEEALRVPMIVRYPPLAPTARQDNRLVMTIDLAPTFLSLAGAAPLPATDGVSMEGLIANNPGTWRSDFVAEGWRITDVTAKPWACVHEARWKYTEYTTGEQELYDLQTDPFELTNVSNVPANATRLATMAQRLRALRPTWPADAGCVDQDVDGRAGPGNAAWCSSAGPDCDDTNGAVWGTPGEVPLAWTWTSKQVFRWQPPTVLGGVTASPVYDVLKSPFQGNFTTLGSCLETDDGTDTLATDSAVPPVGAAFFYLIRAENACPGGVGSLGFTGSGLPRTGLSCP